MTAIRKTIRKGFTLLELSVAMMVGMTAGAILIAMLNQQLSFLNIFRAQSFLNEEAPMISHHVSKLLLQAERFRLHSSLDEALAGEAPVLTDSPVVVLNFRQPDGTIRVGVLSFEESDEGAALYYYIVSEAGVLSEPEWAVTERATDVSFYVESGILRTRLTGPAGEQITFSGAM